MATSRPTPAAKKKLATFSLAAAEKEWSEQDHPEPFTADLDGDAPITLVDPNDVDITELGNLDAESPVLALRTLIRDDAEFDRAIAAGLKARHLRALVAAWQEHYGIGNSGN